MRYASCEMKASSCSQIWSGVRESPVAGLMTIWSRLAGTKSRSLPEIPSPFMSPLYVYEKLFPVPPV